MYQLANPLPPERSIDDTYDTLKNVAASIGLEVETKNPWPIVSSDSETVSPDSVAIASRPLILATCLG